MTVSVADLEVDNPTAGDVGVQLAAITPNATVTNATAAEEFQVLSDGSVVFLADLPASTTKQFNILDVLAGKYPVTSPLTYSETTDLYTVENEYYIVKIRKTMNLGSPLTPVQSVESKISAIDLTGSTHFSSWSSTFFGSGMVPTLTDYIFEVIEAGPLVVKVKATYKFTHPDYYNAAILVFPADNSGNAYASETIEIRAGVNAVFFEVDSVHCWVSGFDISNLDVDQQRYRGHSSSSIANGYVNVAGPAQEQYTINDPDHVNRTAIKDLTGALILGDYNNNPFVPMWNRFVTNTGRWIISRDSSGSSDYYVGIIGGPGSRAIGTNYAGACFTGWGTSTKIEYAAYGRSPSSAIVDRIRYAWAYMVGTEPVPDDTTLLEPGEIQNQQIYCTLTKLPLWAPQSPTETFYAQSIYMTPAQQAALIADIQGSSAYADSLIAKDSTAQALIEYIEDPTLVRAEALYDEIMAIYDAALYEYWFTDGYLDHLYGYIGMAQTVLREFPNVPFLMQDANLTAEQKANIYEKMLFFGNVMADEDFVPSVDPDQFQYGNANQVLQYINQKDSLHLLLLNNPTIYSKFDIAGFPARVISRMEAYISEHGSSKGSPHYTQTGVVPAFNLVQQANVAGVADILSQTDRVESFANFWFSVVTPEDSRFGGLRKIIASGDGSLERTEIHGQLGTILVDANPSLSARLMDVWDAFGQPHDGFYQHSFLKIDVDLPRADMALTDQHFPDYWSVLRSGFGTSTESAIWFMHGDWYTDHRHNDTGSMYCYLLGKPIALDWSSFGTPHIGGSILHNGLTLVSDMTWDGTGGLVPVDTSVSANGIEEGSGTFDLNAITYTSSSTRPQTEATFDLDASTTWTRTVTLNKEEAARPVVVITDTYAGTNASDEKVLSMNLMMTGAVVTPDGDTTPSTTANRATSTDKTALASGWTTFEFTGQWGVNLILMVYNVASANYQLGRFSHTYSPEIEKNEYLEAVGSAYVEMQYQFRLWSTANSKFVLVPWLDSGVKPTVTTSGMDVLVDGDVVT